MAANPLEAAAARMNAPALVVLPLGDLQAPDPEPVRYVTYPLVPRGVATLGSGHGGAGKSIIFGVILGAHVAVGAPFCGQLVERGKVLFVSLEDPAHLVRGRLHHAVQAYGLNAAAVAKNFIIAAPPEGGDPVLAGEIGTEFGPKRLHPTKTFDELVELAVGCALIIVDNASDAFDGNENDRRQVRAFVRMLAQVAHDNDAGLILLAHVDKASAKFGGLGNTYSGSTAWHNSVRSRLALVEKAGVVEITQEKLNLGQKLKGSLVLRWSDLHGTFMPAGEGDAVADSSADADHVLQAIRLAATRGVEVKAARSGPATTQRILETLELPANLRGQRGRDAFWSAIGRLHTTGRIEERDSWTASRHRCRVIIETGTASIPIAAQYPTPRDAEPAKPAIRVPKPPGFAGSTEPAQTRETRDAAAEDYRAASRGS